MLRPSGVWSARDASCAASARSCSRTPAIGRNAAAWWHHEKSEDRYNYLYSGEELQEFAEIATAANELVKKSYLYTNNHFASKSVVNAVMLKAQVGQSIDGEYPKELAERYPEIANLVVTSRPVPVPSRLPVE